MNSGINPARVGGKSIQLDRNDSKSDRPSLFKVAQGGHDNIAAPQRILTDMRGDAATPRALTPNKTASGSRSGAWFLLLAVLGLGAVGTALLLINDTSPDQRAHISAVPPTMTPAEPSAGVANAAVLVGSEDAESQKYSDPLEVIAKNASRAPDAGATAYAEAGPIAAANSGAPRMVASAQRTSSSRKPAARATKPSSASADTDLLAALLTNIRDSPAPPASAVQKPQSLDDLVAQILVEQPSPSSKEATVKMDPPAQGSAKLQTRLRNCPPANTLKGITCRQQLCATHKGADPACPKKLQ